jgi:hypothetical protein
MLISTLSLLLLFLYPGVKVGAQAVSSSALLLSPSIQRIVIRPGEKSEVKFKLKNIDQKEVFVTTKVMDVALDNNGYPRYLDESVRPSHSIKTLVVNNAVPIVLSPSQELEVSLPIIVPDDKLSGVYYGTIVFSGSDDADILAGNGLASNLVFEVQGTKLRQDASVTNFEIARSLPSGGSFKLGYVSSSMANRINLVVENTGESLLSPTGNIEITRKFSSFRESFDFGDTDTPNFVMPGSTRLIPITLSNLSLKPGIYDVKGTVLLSGDGDVRYVSASYVFVPLWMYAGMFLVASIVAIKVARKHRSKSICMAETSTDD